MKIAKIVMLSLVVPGLVFTFAFAAGDAAKGKALFNDKKFAGGSKACNYCHANGKGMDKTGEKKEFHIMGKMQKSLEEAVNACIEGGNKGKAIDVKSAQMQDMVAYIKSLKAAEKPAEKAAEKSAENAPAKKAAGGY